MIDTNARLRILSGYLGTQCLISEPGIDPVQDTLQGIDFVSKQVISERVRYPVEWISILVKSLKDITDEDAVEVAKICGVSDSDFYTDQFERYRSKDRDGNDVFGYHLVGKAFIKYIFKRGDRVWHSNPRVFITMSQYLQSKGYALPYLNYSVEQIVEAGVYKLI